MKWIIKILKKEPYKVTCIWNDNVTRTIDFEPFLKKRTKTKKDSFYQLLDKSRFLQVKCDGTTLYWKDGIMMTDLDGRKVPAPLDIDPEVLFEMTTREKTTKRRKEKIII